MRTLLLLTLLLCLGCADRGTVYTIRGQVIGLPSPSSNPRQLSLDHEAVDNFVNREGKVSGMDSMGMPFPVGKRVSLDGIEVGDIVEFDLRVDWEAEDRPVEIVDVRELPPDTQLDFRLAEPEKHQHHGSTH
ncbi:MAG TPA: copper-binding protein [Thermoanaerobaculia bacterium]|nr:copper-binding protein [Thermoanaerobaculia bacterium]